MGNAESNMNVDDSTYTQEPSLREIFGIEKILKIAECQNCDSDVSDDSDDDEQNSDDSDDSDDDEQEEQLSNTDHWRATTEDEAREPEVEPTTSSHDCKDHALLNTFKSILSEGYLVTLHRAKGRPRNVRVSIDSTDPNVLRWAMTKSITRRQYSLHLTDVIAVQFGNHSFTRDFASAPLSVDELRCFSLVTRSSTLDIETSSKMEREAMAQGFIMLMDDIHQSFRTPSPGPDSGLLSTAVEERKQQPKVEQIEDVPSMADRLAFIGMVLRKGGMSEQQYDDAWRDITQYQDGAMRPQYVVHGLSAIQRRKETRSIFLPFSSRSSRMHLESDGTVMSI